MLNIILFVVLVASVGVAWTLTLTSGRDAHKGLAVMDDLRKQGADAVWNGGTARWFIIRQQGKPIGWKLTARVARANGAWGTLDTRVAVENGQVRGYWSYSELANDLSRSTYRAGRLDIRNGGLTAIPLDDTVITFADGCVQAVQTISRMKQKVKSSDCPEGNYIPEGALPLVRVMVARKQTSGRFKLVSDYMPPNGSRTRFAIIEIAYEGAGGDRFPGTAKVRSQMVSPAVASERVSFLDDQGNLAGAVDGQLEILAATRQEVMQLEILPNPAVVLPAVIRRSGFPIPRLQLDSPDANSPADPNATGNQ